MRRALASTGWQTARQVRPDKILQHVHFCLMINRCCPQTIMLTEVWYPHHNVGVIYSQYPHHSVGVITRLVSSQVSTLTTMLVSSEASNLTMVLTSRGLVPSPKDDSKMSIIFCFRSRERHVFKQPAVQKCVHTSYIDICRHTHTIMYIGMQ